MGQTSKKFDDARLKAGYAVLLGTTQTSGQAVRHAFLYGEHCIERHFSIKVASADLEIKSNDVLTNCFTGWCICSDSCAGLALFCDVSPSCKAA